MNSVLYIARKAKGLTEEQLARLLNMDEKTYVELENEVRLLDKDTCFKLRKIFDIPADYFYISIKREATLRANTMKDVLSLLKLPGAGLLPPEIHVKMVAMGTEALIAHQELYAAYHEIDILKRENVAIRDLYTALIEEERL